MCVLASWEMQQKSLPVFRNHPYARKPPPSENAPKKPLITNNGDRGDGTSVAKVWGKFPKPFAPKLKRFWGRKRINICVSVAKCLLGPFALKLRHWVGKQIPSKGIDCLEMSLQLWR
ncbi:hypothetical protein VNO77_07035 [Canavalia gladiata]|uniref:Uncharacterized protein n=1 Tax=Canavalia gladiata TaxID=3824 RepID=A0AAN9M8T5_CANGL